jgi:DHA1 family tetracycline resistance protein-like MFS transporter
VLIVIGVCVTLISIILLWFSATQTMFVIAMMCNGMGQGFSMPAINTSMSLAAGPDAQGRLAGISTSCQSIAFLLAPASAAAFYQVYPWLPFASGGVVTVIALILFLGTPIIDGRVLKTESTSARA